MLFRFLRPPPRRESPRRPSFRPGLECLEDRALSAEMSAVTIERLGVDPLTIPGSHSPFLSRPAELAELLVAAVDTRPLRAPSPD